MPRTLEIQTQKKPDVNKENQDEKNSKKLNDIIMFDCQLVFECAKGSEGTIGHYYAILFETISRFSEKELQLLTQGTLLAVAAAKAIYAKAVCPQMATTITEQEQQIKELQKQIEELTASQKNVTTKNEEKGSSLSTNPNGFLSNSSSSNNTASSSSASSSSSTAESSTVVTLGSKR